MSRDLDYFNKVTYKPEYQIGDRVRGIWNQVPFTGSVAVDTMVDQEDGPYVMVFLDLPIRHDDNTHTIIKVRHTDFIDAGGTFLKNKKSKKNGVCST